MNFRSAANRVLPYVQSWGGIYIVVVVAAGLYFSLKSREAEIGIISLLLALGSGALALSEHVHPKDRHLKGD